MRLGRDARASRCVAACDFHRFYLAGYFSRTDKWTTIEEEQEADEEKYVMKIGDG